ncbi:MAG: PrpR N-terminal domain-containing protein, partial [Gammaproteobacteria bacterium]
MNSPLPAARPRVLVVGYRKFGELMNVVAEEFRDRAEIRIVEHLMIGDEPSGAVLGREGADMVISAGANATWLAAMLSVPVVALEVTDAELVEAIAKARDIAPRILLLSYGEPRAVLAPLERLAGLEIEQRSYKTVDEAREQFLLARGSGCGVVV